MFNKLKENPKPVFVAVIVVILLGAAYFNYGGKETVKADPTTQAIQQIQVAQPCDENVKVVSMSDANGVCTIVFDNGGTTPVFGKCADQKIWAVGQGGTQSCGGGQ